MSEKLRQRLANHQPGREAEANSGNSGTLLLRFCSQTKTKTAESISDVSPHGHISCSHKQEEKKQLLVAKKNPLASICSMEGLCTPKQQTCIYGINVSVVSELR